MMLEVIERDWLEHLKKELDHTDKVRIISPFITLNMANKLVENFRGSQIRVITRYNLNEFRSGVSNLSALKVLLVAGTKIKSVQGLHSKLYLFDKRSAIIASANFTNGGFFNNYEFGIKTTEPKSVKDSIRYFKKLWKIDSTFLSAQKLEKWDSEIAKAPRSIAVQSKLPDYGSSIQKSVLKNRRYFIKFFGQAIDGRLGLGYSVRDQISDSHCHYALTFSRTKNDRRPNRYRDGDVAFMAHLLEGGDYAIYGRAIAYAHDRVRDVANDRDIEEVHWREQWPIMIRVQKPKFIDATFAECPKMNELINSLGYESFQSTLRRHKAGETDIQPKRSLQQKADVEISELAALWLEDQFKRAIDLHDPVPKSFISKFYQGRPL